MSSFFTLPASQRKRKRSSGAPATSSKRTTISATRPSTDRTRPKKPARDESISGSDDSVSSNDDKDAADDDEEITSSAASDAGGSAAAASSDAGDETAADRRLRLAERYLANLRDEAADEAAAGGFDAAEIDRAIIAERLREDAAEAKGTTYRRVAGELAWERAVGTTFRADQNALTGVALHGKWVWTVGKDRSIAMWEVPGASGVERVNDVGKEMKDEEMENNGDVETDTKENGRTENQRGPKTHPRRKPYLRSFTRPSGRQPKKPKHAHASTTPFNASSLGPILAVAISPSGHLLATGHASHHVAVWRTGLGTTTTSPTPPQLTLLKILAHTHRAAITSLCFRLAASTTNPARPTTTSTSYSDANMLYTASADRTVKVWSLDALAHVETLFGHQDVVQHVAALRKDVCVSVGGRDRTARFWRVGEEKMLVFRGGGGVAAHPEPKQPINGVNGARRRRDEEGQKEKEEVGWRRDARRGRYVEGSLDRVAMLDDGHFVTGSDNGALCLWHTAKKKPIFTVPLAHGLDPPPPIDNGDGVALDHVNGVKTDHPLKQHEPDRPSTPRWITALAALPYSDLVLSGSWDGVVRGWSVNAEQRRLEPAGVLGAETGGAEEAGAIRGVVTDIALEARGGPRCGDGVRVVVAAAKEQRLGRWSEAAGLGVGGGKGWRNAAWVFDVGRRTKSEVEEANEGTDKDAVEGAS